MSARGAALLGLLLFPALLPAAPPEDLTLVPPGAFGFVRLRVTDLWNSPALEDQRTIVELASKEALAVFQDKLGLKPGDVERVTIVLPTPAALDRPAPDGNPMTQSSLFIVSLSGAYDRPRLLRSLVPNAVSCVQHGKTYHLDTTSWGCVWPVSDRTFVFGSEELLVWLLDRRQHQADGPLSDALARAAGKGHIVAGFNASMLPKEAFGLLPASIHPLSEARSAVLGIDFEKNLSIGVRLHFPGAEKAREGEKALRAFVQLGRGQLTGLQEMLKQQAKAEQTSPGEAILAVYGLAWLRKADALLQSLPIKQDGVRVEATLKLDEGLPLPMLTFCLTAISSLGTNSQNTFNYVGDAVNVEKGPDVQMQKIHAALEAYHKEHGHYPPAAISAKDGTPLLSWRVALLPYLGEKKLHDEFKLDEPWYGPNNKRLLARMPGVYRTGWSARQDQTRLEVFSGPDAVFDARKGRLKTEITGPVSERLLVVRMGSGDGARWIRPSDMPHSLGQSQKLPDGASLAGITALFVDGSVRQLNGVKEPELRAMIARQVVRKTTVR